MTVQLRKEAKAMREKYEVLEMEVIHFDQEDVITTSGGDGEETD